MFSIMLGEALAACYEGGHAKASTQSRRSSIYSSVLKFASPASMLRCYSAVDLVHPSQSSTISFFLFALSELAFCIAA